MGALSSGETGARGCHFLREDVPGGGEDRGSFFCTWGKRFGKFIALKRYHEKGEAEVEALFCGFRHRCSVEDRRGFSRYFGGRSGGFRAEQFHGAVVMLHDGGAAFDPVARVEILDVPDLPDR